MFRKHAAVLATALLVGGLVAAGAAPASARVVERYSFSESGGGDVEDFCGVEGLTVESTFSVQGSGVIRTRGNDLEWFHERTRVVQTFTYDGSTVTDIQPNTLSKDHKIVDNGDGTITIIALLTGGSRVVGDNGRVLAKNDGQVRFRIVIDTATGEELSSELIFGSTGTNDDSCAAIIDYWGL